MTATTTWILALLIARGAAPAPAAPVATPDGLLVYSGLVEITPTTAELAARLEIELPGTGDDEHLELLLNGALEIDRLHGDGVLGFDREPLSPGADWDRLSVHLERLDSPGPRTLHIAYSGSPEMPDDGINGISDDWIELSVDSAWFPMLASLDRELRARLEVHVIEDRHVIGDRKDRDNRDNRDDRGDWQVVSSGTATATERGFVLDHRIPQVDIAFVAARGLVRDEAPGFEIYHRGSAPVDAILAAAGRCRTYLDTWFGADDPLPDARFVVAERRESGYARKNYIVLTRSTDHDDRGLTEFLCHELAHTWSSGAPPLTADNWLNEGFAVYVSVRALGAFHGQAAWDAAVADWRERAADTGSIWTADDLSRRSHAVNYKAAPLALLELEQKIGTVTFERLLVRYMTDGIDSTPALLDALAEVADREARDWFVERLARPVPEAP